MKAIITPIFNSALLINGFTVFDSYGLRGLVFNSDYLYEKPLELYSMMQTYILLLANTFGYIVLYYYFSQVFPGNFGTPRPFYFPLMVCIFDVLLFVNKNPD